MFRNRDDELRRLEEELLAEEYEEEEDFDEGFDEDFDDFEEEAPVHKGYVNRYEEDDFDDVDDTAGVFVSEQEERAKRREQRGMAFMTLASLVMAGLLAWWWLKWR